MFIIFRKDVATTRLQHVFDIESFIQEISIVKQVFTLTPSFIFLFDFVQINIYIYIYIFKRLKKWTFCQNH